MLRTPLRTRTFVRMQSVLFNLNNTSRVVTLNRANKLNSLNTEMVESITPRLVEYSKSHSAGVVILNSSTQRALCAGGDVAQAAQWNLAGEQARSVDFFSKEYSLNYLMATYPKPIVSVMDGITFGGGVGLSIHSSFRIATENTRWAMPEMDIGFFPDVGTTFALSRVLDGSLGTYLALTGESLTGLDALFGRVATHYVPSVRLEALYKRLGELDSHASYEVVNNAIEDFVDPVPADYKFPYSHAERQLIDEVFSLGKLDAIYAALEHNGSEFATKTLATLKAKSQISLQVALELIKRHSKTHIFEAITQEARTAENFMYESDFTKAVEHKLLNKNKTPYEGFQQDVSTKLLQGLLSRRADSQAIVEPAFDVTFSEYPHDFAVPSQEQVRQYITGEDGSGRTYAVSKKEVLKRFGEKAGAREAVLSILERFTEPYEESPEFLKWKD